MLSVVGGHGPAGIYLLINQGGLECWAVPAAMDVAFSLAALKVLTPD